MTASPAFASPVLACRGSEKIPRSIYSASLLLALSLLAAVPADAQHRYLAALGGIGGALDGDPLDHPALEVQIGYPRGVRDLVVVRLGQIDLSASDALFDFDGELTWLTLSSEYRLPEGYYISGLFIGLGYYQRRNDFGIGEDEGVGVTLGVDGEFALTDQWGVLLQLTGHWADLEADQAWTTALGGITFSF